MTVAMLLQNTFNSWLKNSMIPRVNWSQFEKRRRQMQTPKPLAG
jgi:hypothetical protein